jgi:hypothetical protein|mmetsp:Transcript_37222/g.97826  ORF Transcript_37222/g.97826 Transcript_37222/m.97826 type:complete len:366 (-) Transcript_37222:138-1235(-)
MQQFNRGLAPHVMTCGTAGDLGHLATGLFFKQGDTQAACCSFHAAQAKAECPEEFAQWTLTKITPVSRHSAMYHFTSTDSSRGTPYTRGRGRTVWHKTWHTTLRAETAEGGHVERDFTPVSTWMDWDSGECDLLVHIDPSEPAAVCMHKQPLGSEVLLSKPKKSLSVPSLVPDVNQYETLTEVEHKGILLVLGGTSGLPVVAQVMQHADPTACFGTKPAPRRVPLLSPVHLIYSCSHDDVLLTSELARWCAAEHAIGPRLQRLVLAVSSPREDRDAAFPQAEAEEAPGFKELETLDNVSILRGESPLTSELLQTEMAAMLTLGRCRVVVSGPASFSVAVAEKLEAQCKVDPSAITIWPSPVAGNP